MNVSFHNIWQNSTVSFSWPMLMQTFSLHSLRFKYSILIAQRCFNNYMIVCIMFEINLFYYFKTYYQTSWYSNILTDNLSKTPQESCRTKLTDASLFTHFLIRKIDRPPRYDLRCSNRVKALTKTKTKANSIYINHITVFRNILFC